MIKVLENVKVVLTKDPFVKNENNDIVLLDFYKFRPMKKNTKISLERNFVFDSMYYIPCESNIYHSTVYSAMYLPYIPKTSIVCTNNSDVLKFYLDHFNLGFKSEPGNYYVKTLYYFDIKAPIYTNPDQFDKSSLDLFLNMTSNLRKSIYNCPKFIYIKRQTKTRCIQNCSEFEHLLHRKGFTFYVMENYTVQEQINIFHNARFVLGVHGAGLTNIIHCKKECVILELKHKGMDSFLIHNCYKQLAYNSLIQNYNVVYNNYIKIKNVKSKDYNLIVDVNALSIHLDNLMKST